MSGFSPNTPYTTPAFVKNVIGTKKIKSVSTKIYSERELIYISFRTFGGTERTSNDQVVVERTGTVETWYRPDITSDSLITIAGTTYEILGEPENVNMRNQRLVFKVRAVGGGA